MGPWSRAGLVLAATVLVDQVSKVLIRHHLAQGDEDPVFPAVSLVHTRNKGVAFGALAGGRTIVVVVIAVALVALLVYFATHTRRPWVWLPTGLVLGGSVGNIADRVRDGAVTDFIKLPGWPAFNIADMAITFGVLGLLAVLERSDDGADGGS